MKALAALLVLLAACAADGPSYVPGFSPPAAEAGYTRVVTPPVMNIQPGDDLNYCQWIADPSTVDQQIIKVGGYQSVGGHHLTLYATTIKEKVGTSRICTNDDMLAITFLGAVGGEGNGTNVVTLPDGLAFSYPKGQALMVNAHYINATDNVIDGQSVADIQYADPKHPLQPVGFLAVNWTDFMIPTGGMDYTSEATCTATQKLSFFMWGNHMHEYGVSETSTLIRQDGSQQMLAADPHWSKELTFHTNWVKWDPATPMVVNAGDKFHLSCTWRNTTPDVVGFPREMCVATGFVLEAMPQSICEAM